MKKGGSYLIRYNEDKFINRMDPYFYHPDFKNKIFNEKWLVPISKVVKMVYRKPKPGKTYRYVQISSINNNTLEINNFYELEEFKYEELPSRAKKVVQKGDILFSKLVNNPLITVVKDEHDGCVATNAFIIIRPKIDVSSEFIAYILCLKPVIKQFKRYSYGHITQITNKDFEKVKIPIPPVHIIDKIETWLKEHKEKQNKIIKQYNKLLNIINEQFLEMLNFNFKNHNNKSDYSFLIKGEMIDAEKFHPSFYSPEYISILEMIDNSNFRKFILKEIIEELTIGHPIKPSKSFSKKYLTSSNIKPIEIDLSEIKGTEIDSSLPLLNVDDLVVVSSGYNLGVTAIVNEKAVGYSFNNHIYRIKVKDYVNPYYLMLFLNSNLGRIQFERYAGGIAQKNISSKDILNIKVLLPTKERQNKIVTSIIEYYNYVKNQYLNLKEEKKELEERIIKILSKGGMN